MRNWLRGRGSTRFEVRKPALRLVSEQYYAHPAQWVTIRSIARRIGRACESLWPSVRKGEWDSWTLLGIKTEESQWLQALER
jgi:hypothetical protein